MAKETYSSLKVLEFLLDEKVDIIYAVVREKDNKIFDICSKAGIKIVNDRYLETKIDNNELEYIDYIFSFYWKRISKKLLDFPTFGAINFHPGPLPEARGCGYNIAVLNNWNYFGVTAHYMDENFDTGEIIEKEVFLISSDIIVTELVLLAHKKLFELFKKIFFRLSQNEKLPSFPQGEGNYYSLEYVESLKQVDLNDEADVIDRKIRAFWYPPYSGATIITPNGKKYTLVNDDILKKITQ
jgi:methionyl-tRNA formyltransferase